MTSFKEKIKEIIWGNQDQTDWVDADQAADQIIDLVDELIGEDEYGTTPELYEPRNRLRADIRQKLRK